MKQDMLEKVARAICVADGAEPNLMLFDPYAAEDGRKEWPQWTEYEDQAQAALTAIEETHAVVPLEVIKSLEWKREDRGHAAAVYKYQDYGELHQAILSAHQQRERTDG